MPTAKKTAKQAIDWMRDRYEAGETKWKGMCQSSVRQAWGLPGGVASAKAALAQAKEAGRFHTYTGARSLKEWERDVPKGAVVWTDRPAGSKYGHIILAGGVSRKTKRRVFWSVDIETPGKISPVSIDAFANHWGHKILGWADYLNGHRLPVAPPPNAKRYQ